MQRLALYLQDKHPIRYEIEMATLQGRPYETCGGRSLNDDAMDTVATWLVVRSGPSSDPSGGCGPAFRATSSDGCCWSSP